MPSRCGGLQDRSDVSNPVHQAAALVYALIRIADDGLDLSATVTAISGVVGSGATVFLVKKSNEAIKVARGALGDVGTYCGKDMRDEIAQT